MSDDEPKFTQEHVNAIVQKRLRAAREESLNASVVLEMLRSVIERLDAIEEKVNR